MARPNFWLSQIFGNSEGTEKMWENLTSLGAKIGHLARTAFEITSSVDTFPCTDTTTIRAAAPPISVPFLSKFHYQSISSSYLYLPRWQRGMDCFPFTDHYRGWTAECTRIQAGFCLRKTWIRQCRWIRGLSVRRRRRWRSVLGRRNLIGPPGR